MRGQAAALAVVLLGTAAPIGAQSEQAAEEPRTAEQFIETAREAYSVRERPEPIVCAAPVGNEIVVCARSDKPDDQRLASPTDRAYAAGELPPDPIPSAPNVDGPGIFRGKGITMGKDPPPIYIIDLAAIPEALTPEEAALVFRAEDRPTPEEASPAAAP